MGDIYMTAETGRKLMKFAILVLLLFLLLTGVVFLQSIIGRSNLAEASRQARSELVDSQRHGCERGKLDRRANARGWRTAQKARMKTLAQDLDISYKEVTILLGQLPRADDPPDLVSARRYDEIAAELEERSRINCAQAFPKERR